jgi:hypothetical protein
LKKTGDKADAACSRLIVARDVYALYQAFFYVFSWRCIAAFHLAQPATASKKAGLSLSSVILESPGTEEFGPVPVEIQRSDEGIEKLMASAFGRNETAPGSLGAFVVAVISL